MPYAYGNRLTNMNGDQKQHPGEISPDFENANSPGKANLSGCSSDNVFLHSHKILDYGRSTIHRNHPDDNATYWRVRLRTCRGGERELTLQDSEIVPFLSKINGKNRGPKKTDNSNESYESL